MGWSVIIDRRSDPDQDQVRKRGSASIKDRVTNGGSAIPIHKKRIGAHRCIYDTLILLYLCNKNINNILVLYYYIDNVLH